MIATCARSSLSMVTPSGMNSGSMTVAMKRMLISGTPRTISMKPTARTRIAGRLEARASASTMPSGSASVSPYAVEAMRWAVGAGIVNGMDGKLNPQGEATRAQMATMLMRYAKLAA